MMPPKKSRAARGANQNSIAGETEMETNENGQEEVDATQTGTESEEHEDSSKKQKPEKTEKKTEKKYLWDDQEHVDGKRKRMMPAAEQKLNDWLSEHLEERVEIRVATQEIYSSYLEACISTATFGVDQLVFAKILKQRFPKGYGIKESSAYHGVIKEKKMRKKVPKVQADSLKLKMKDIIEKAITENGNPKKGVRFHTLKQNISLRYPALRIELRPAVLKNALQKGVRFGHWICVKGIGACGFYCLPGAEDQEEEVKKPKKEKKEDVKEEDEKEKEKENKEEEKKEKKEGEESKVEKSKEEVTEEKEADKEDTKRKTRTRKRKATDEESSKKKKKGSKGKKSKPAGKKYRSYIVHSDPQRIEDSFPMALTFMSEPKEASVNKIKKYICEYYDDNNIDARLKKALQTGLEKGYWEQVTGSGPSAGTFCLLLNEFDPTADDDMIGMITNALMACNEPKQCSANLIKKYILEYHADFNITERPTLFKKALERALKKDILRQLSGIGASGSFQLVKSFLPSPTILSGEDTEDDYGDDDYSGSNKKIKREDIDIANIDMSDFLDNYVPRATKSRGHGRSGAAGIERLTIDPARQASISVPSGRVGVVRKHSNPVKRKAPTIRAPPRERTAPSKKPKGKAPKDDITKKEKEREKEKEKELKEKEKEKELKEKEKEKELREKEKEKEKSKEKGKDKGKAQGKEKEKEREVEMMDDSDLESEPSAPTAPKGKRGRSRSRRR